MEPLTMALIWGAVKGVQALCEYIEKKDTHSNAETNKDAGKITHVVKNEKVVHITKQKGILTIDGPTRSVAQIIELIMAAAKVAYKHKEL